MEWILRLGEEVLVARSCDRARAVTLLRRKRHPSRGPVKPLKSHHVAQSPDLVLLRTGQRRARLVVLAPRRPTLLARSQNTGGQTIPYQGERL